MAALVRKPLLFRGSRRSASALIVLFREERTIQQRVRDASVIDRIVEHLSAPTVARLQAFAQTPVVRWSRAGTWLIACSAIAVMVKLGFTPRFAGMTDPSTM